MMGVLEVIRAVVCWQGLNLFGVFFVISFESNAKQTLHLWCIQVRSATRLRD
jgi:hypothetical protein